MLKKFKKILKKFNIIDFLGIGLFFITLAVAAVFFLRKSSYAYVTLEISTNNDSSYNFWFHKPTDWYINNLKIDSDTKDLLGRENLKLVDVYYYPNLDFKISAQTVFVTLKVKTIYNQYNQQYSYQGQPLLIGEHRVFQIGSVVIPGIIHSVDTNIIKPKTKKILVEGILDNEDNEEIERDAEVKFLGVKNYLVNEIIPGSLIKDSNGRKIAEILEVEKSSGHKEFIYQNSLVKVFDKDRTQVRLLLELEVVEVNGYYFYREEDKILLGNKIPLSFEDFNVYFRIEKILN